MPFSAKRWAYSDMPSFSSQSVICCIGAPWGEQGSTLSHKSVGHYTQDLPLHARPLLAHVQAGEPCPGQL